MHINSGNDVKINVGIVSILLKNAKNKTITINNSRNFIEEHWFTEDNNFAVNDLNSITNDKSNDISVSYKFNVENKFIAENLLTSFVQK